MPVKLPIANKQDILILWNCEITLSFLIQSFAIFFLSHTIFSIRKQLN